MQIMPTHFTLERTYLNKHSKEVATMQYIHKGKTHSDTSNEYMTALGMSDEQIESVLNQLEFEKTKLEQKAKLTRISALNFVEFDGVVFDADTEALSNIAKTIHIAENMDYKETYTHLWRLADNTTRLTTLAELREVLLAHDAKYINVWDQFNEWVAGDKSTAFTIK